MRLPLLYSFRISSFRKPWIPSESSPFCTMLEDSNWKTGVYSFLVPHHHHSWISRVPQLSQGDLHLPDSQTEQNSLESLTGTVKSCKPILLILFTVKSLTFKQPVWYLNFWECLWKTWLFGQKNIRLQNERHFVENNTVIMQHVSKMQ